MKTLITAFSALLLIFAGCSTEPKSAEGKQEMHKSAQQTMDEYYRVDPSMKGFIQRTYGYAIIPSVGKGGLIVGGAYGNGEVYEKGMMIGWCDVSQATVGAQIGGQSYSELLVFENKAALDKFKANQFEFAAQASAVALKSGASADAKFDHGVAVFTMANGGAMLEASIGGQSFTFKPKNPDTSMTK